MLLCGIVERSPFRHCCKPHSLDERPGSHPRFDCKDFVCYAFTSVSYRQRLEEPIEQRRHGG